MFKTILVHVDLSVHAPARIRFACALAQAHNACLVGAAMVGVSRAVFPNGYDCKPGTLAASCFEPLANNAKRALENFEAIVGEWNIPYEERFVSDEADNGLTRHARFADLVVISQDDPEESMPDMAVQLPEYLIMNGARPVLLVPRTDPKPDRISSVLLAWDGSKEASYAMSGALPLLRGASEVNVVALAARDEEVQEFRDQQPALLDFLRRHEISPGFHIRDLRGDTGRQLLDLAAELNAGLLVMGCYGHSRMRELYMGGASRTVLADTTIPVLLAH
ncbi:universal stress protein [Massilia terrae]|uniref:Universal stress protein n=1 Tax=Massilia terrae TaxID=1811224 RepID=A0ABT2CS48_9BURK|nr:universal stress protein [Massilia terrae]MCS0656808.1 universal stress protein [Massilia terrae]